MSPGEGEHLSRKDGHLDKASNPRGWITRRTIAVFLNRDPRHPIRVNDLAKRFGVSYHAVNSACRRMKEKRYLRRVSYGSYQVVTGRLVALREELNVRAGFAERTRLVVSSQDESPFKKFLDFGAAVIERSQRTGRLDALSTAKVRRWLAERGVKPKGDGAAMWWREQGWTIGVYRKGGTVVWVKDAEFLGSLLKFLKGCGLGQYQILRFLDQILRRPAPYRAEIPLALARDAHRLHKLKAVVSDPSGTHSSLNLNFSGNHDVGELEARGVDDNQLLAFVGGLIGTQLASHYQSVTAAESVKARKLLQTLPQDTAAELARMLAPVYEGIATSLGRVAARVVKEQAETQPVVKVPKTDRRPCYIG